MGYLYRLSAVFQADNASRPVGWQGVWPCGVGLEVKPDP